ncbi:amino acid racemase [Calidifontibacter sp. DB0510]|uniref:Amino acid racemase n=1 Tax=Metallococcus carri TaxID=1656884 RepID=A0A967B2R8_9MICO|nr:amino acid racemase [Metallococcus carri]NHN54582.1 amino acid racemase [Metallococcus carri]NOP36579.1 amino acid racemase [Calidifontibacter sp. DB2511S]
MTSAPLTVAADPAWPGPTVGVIGGNGPAATALYLKLLVDRTPAKRDQDHLDLIVLDHASQPDRTARILSDDAPDPGPVLARDAARLEAYGAAFITIPCNTAYHFLPQISSATTLPIISIVEETAKAAIARGPRVGLLATDGTRAAGVYQKVLDALGAQIVLPSEEDQRLVMSVIYDGVKAGGPVDVEGLEAVIGRLSAGSDVVALGCTELSIVYDEQGWRGRPELVDSVESLVLATIRQAGRTPR